MIAITLTGGGKSLPIEAAGVTDEASKAKATVLVIAPFNAVAEQLTVDAKVPGACDNALTLGIELYAAVVAMGVFVLAAVVGEAAEHVAEAHR